MLLRLLVLGAFIFILISLFTALYYMMSDKGDSSKMVKALTIRIGASILLFGLIMLGFVTGYIQPHGIYPQ